MFLDRKLEEGGLSGHRFLGLVNTLVSQFLSVPISSMTLRCLRSYIKSLLVLTTSTIKT